MTVRSASLAAAFLCLVLSAADARAETAGTAAEAKALVDQGVAFIKKHGREGGLAEITRAADGQGTLVDRDLYIFAYDFSGVVVAHGANKKLIGKNLSDMQDTDGLYVIRTLMDTAKRGSGWVDYKWSHPQTKKIHQKRAYVVKIDDSLWIGCGAYGGN